MNAKTYLEEAGISPANISRETVVSIRGTFVSLVDSIKSEMEGTDTEKAKLSELLDELSSDENVEAVDAAMRTATIAIFSAISTTPELSVLFVDRLDTLTKQVREEREYVRRYVLSNDDDDDAEVDSTLVERAELAKEVRDILHGVVKMAKLLDVNLTPGDDLPFVDSKRGEGQTVSLPNVPNPDPNVWGTRRQSKNTTLKFTFDGQELPEGLHAAQVIHDYVSDHEAGNVTTWADIVTTLKDQNVDVFGKEGWTLQVFGKELSASR